MCLLFRDVSVLLLATATIWININFVLFLLINFVFRSYDKRVMCSNMASRRAYCKKEQNVDTVVNPDLFCLRYEALRTNDNFKLGCHVKTCLRAAQSEQGLRCPLTE